MVFFDRRTFKMVLFSIVCVTYLSFLVFDAVAYKRTYDNMQRLQEAIVAYHAAQGEVPLSLAALSRATSRIPLQDAWGNAIVYQTFLDGNVTITSLGRDGKPGGKDENTDVVISFKL